MADAIARGDLDSAPLSDQERTMLEYVRKLTLAPAEVEAGDIERLHNTGFDDEAIGHIALTTAIYAMMNRIVDGLGDDLPRGMEREALRLRLIERESAEQGAVS